MGPIQEQGIIFCSMEKDMKTESFVHHRTVSAVKTVEFVSDGKSNILPRGCSHNIVLNVHAPNEEICDYSKDRFYEKLGQASYHFPKYHMKILLGDFKAKLERGKIFKPTNKNESLYHNSNDNAVRIVNCATSKNLLKAQCFCTEIFTNSTGSLRMERQPH
jgi:hypothetical protein